MRLKYIKIGNYKNLKDFELELDGESFIDVFVGRNGTGKSNLLEAIISIFKRLIDNDTENSFEYHIKYVINETDVEVKWKAEELFYNNTKVSKVPVRVLPSNIVVYYSGHNSKVQNLITSYENAFRKRIKGANLEDTRKFIGIGKNYKSLLLSIILLQPEDSKVRKYIIDRLGIKSVLPELKVTLERPFYAIKKGYDVDRFDDTTRFWKVEGITQAFLDRLISIKKTELNGSVRNEGYLPNEESYKDSYVYYLDTDDFKAKFLGVSSYQLFKDFDNLKILGMLKDISIEIELNDGSKIDLNRFSDGQFQSIYIYSIIEMFKDKNCLTLLDEPDAFLHPEWQHDFLKQVTDISADNVIKNHVFMTSHSAITLTSLSTPNLFMFQRGVNIQCKRCSKHEGISALSGGLITLTEAEARLNINHFLNNTSKAVLFTEGITDEIIINTAWQKLNPDVLPNFEIQSAFCCNFVRNLLKDETLYAKDLNRKYFGVFDFDEAYNVWNSIKGEVIVSDYHRGLCRKMKDKHGYALLLPVPMIDCISRQVLNPRTGKDYGATSLLTIELLFSHLENLAIHFEVDVNRTDGFKKFKGNKVNFAKNIVPNIEARHFEVFRPMFDLIDSIIAN